MTEYTVVDLPGKGNYAIVLPGQITFALEASKQELNETIKEVLNEYIPEEFDPDLTRTSVSIIPTFDCNLRCIYCYSKGGDSKKVVKKEHVRKLVEYRKLQNPTVEILDLYLVGGGEPFLNFNLAKEIFEIAEEYFKEVKIHTVTNGTFGEEVCEWVIDKNVDTRISYDGIAQSMQRPLIGGKDSTEIVEKNIQKLVSAGIDPMLQMIVTSESINSMTESIYKVVALGCKVLKIEPVLISEISRGSKSLETKPSIYAKKLLEAIQLIADEALPLQIDTGFFTKPSINYYCGMAEENMTLTPDGLLTPCVEVTKADEPYAEKILLGNIDSNGIKILEERKFFLKELHYKNQLGGCQICNLRMFCLGGCPMANIWRNGLPLKKSEYTCTLEHSFLPNLLLKIAENPIIMEVVMEEASRT